MDSGEPREPPSDSTVPPQATAAPQSSDASVQPSRARQLASAFIRKLSDDDVSIHAMSLTYTTILSMVPLLAVTFSVLKAFGVHDQIEPLLAQSLAPLGAEGAALTKHIIEFVRQMQVGVLGAVGVAGLFYTVVTLVGSIEDALNRIWQARQGRAWATKFRDYLSVITVGPVLVFSALALTASAQKHEFVQRVFALAPWLVWLGTVVLPYIIMATAFTLLYRFMPNTIVTWRAAGIGGVSAGVAWKWAGAVFTAFVAGSGRYAAIYSSFAILVLFFLWIYLSWTIVLIGAEIAYLWQNPREVLSRVRGVTLVGREEKGLTLLRALARRHLDGRPPAQTAELAKLAGLPATAVEEIVDQMVEHGVLLAADRPHGVALARPPEAISVYEVLSILRGENTAGNSVGNLPASVADALAVRSDASRAALSEMTLRTLASETEPPRTAP